MIYSLYIYSLIQYIQYTRISHVPVYIIMSFGFNITIFLIHQCYIIFFLIKLFLHVALPFKVDLKSQLFYMNIYYFGKHIYCTQLTPDVAGLWIPSVAQRPLTTSLLRGVFAFRAGL